MATELQLRKLTSRTPVMIAREERSTATGNGRSAEGAFALPVSPKGKEGLCGCPDGTHQGWTAYGSRG
ncbi:hypothetical protein A3N46_24385 [Enterobacter asburiae]|nr:hypothetical protein A3N46_24385 [Enterobacter asburiae]